MKILDKYILKELIGPFIFGVCAFSSIFIASGVLFRMVNLITQLGAPFSAIIKLFFLSLPELINYTFPMSMLLASLLAFGRLSSTSEIIAMKSAGISFNRMVLTVFVMAFIVSLFSMAFAEKVVPASKVAYQQVLYQEVYKNTIPRSQEHIVIKDVSGSDIERLTYARRLDEKEGVMYGVTVEEFDGDNLLHVQNAEKATWTTDAWVLENGTIYDLTGEDGISRSAQFKEQVLPMKLTPNQVARTQKEPNEMSISELRQQIKGLKHQYVSTAKFEVEMYQRFMIPLASLVFAMIGTPLGLQPQRSSSSIGLGLSIIIIFIYYAIMTLMLTLGKSNTISPLLAVMTPNALGFLVGFLLIRKFGK